MNTVKFEASHTDHDKGCPSLIDHITKIEVTDGEGSQPPSLKIYLNMSEEYVAEMGDMLYWRAYGSNQESNDDDYHARITYYKNHLIITGNLKCACEAFVSTLILGQKQVDALLENSVIAAIINKSASWKLTWKRELVNTANSTSNYPNRLNFNHRGSCRTVEEPDDASRRDGVTIGNK